MAQLFRTVTTALLPLGTRAPGAGDCDPPLDGEPIGVSGVLPYVLLIVVFAIFCAVFVRKVRTDKHMEPTRLLVLEDPAVKVFPGIRVRLNPGTQRSGSLKGGSDLTVRSHSFDFSLAGSFGAGFRYYCSGTDAESEPPAPSVREYPESRLHPFCGPMGRQADGGSPGRRRATG